MTSLPKDSPCKPQAHGQAEPGGGPCPLCSRPRCTAAAKTRPGERCRKNPHPGATICTNHGLTEAGRAKAAEKVASDKAEKAIADLIPLVGSAEPVKDPVDLLARVASMLEGATDQVAGRVNLLQGKVGAGEHLSQLRAEVVLLEKLLGHLRAVARDLAALGIAERQVELAAGQADIVVSAFRAGLTAAGAVLVPDVRDAMLRAFLQALGQGDVVVGELEGAAS